MKEYFSVRSGFNLIYDANLPSSKPKFRSIETGCFGREQIKEEEEVGLVVSGIKQRGRQTTQLSQLNQR